MELRPNKLISAMVDIEERGLLRDPVEDSRNEKQKPKIRVVILFLLVVLGILASWFWEVSWRFLANPNVPLIELFGSPLSIIIRIILAFIIAALTFANVFLEIKNKEAEKSVATFIFYFMAFQNGFFWDALLKTVQSSLTL